VERTKIDKKTIPKIASVCRLISTVN
jgi:hypothetical protein